MGGSEEANQRFPPGGSEGTWVTFLSWVCVVERQAGLSLEEQRGLYSNPARSKEWVVAMALPPSVPVLVGFGHGPKVPGKRPPGKRPPGKRPPGKRPPGKRPPGKCPPGKTPSSNNHARGNLQHPSSKHQGNFKHQASSTRETSKTKLQNPERPQPPGSGGTRTAKRRADAGTLRLQLSIERANLGFLVDWMPSETIAWKRRNQPRQTSRPRAGWKRGATSVELPGGSGCRKFFARETVRVWRLASSFEWPGTGLDLGWAFMQI
jgi:hypothetical protein